VSGQLGGLTIARRRLPGGQVRSESLAGRFVSGPDAFIGKGRQAEDLSSVKTNESRVDEILSLAAIANNPEDPLGAVMAYYLGKKHRDDMMDGCPMVALGSDAVRQGAGVKASFEAGIKAHLNVLQSSIFAAGDKRPDSKAMAILSMMVGALLLSRVVNDPHLAQAFLDTAVEQVREVASS
jgi:TetR/AcrR family transcriptional regulator, transcriptional repressor for nem operon